MHFIYGTSHINNIIVDSVRFKLLTIKYVLRMKREITLYCKRGKKEKSFSQIFVIDFNYAYFF